MGKYCGNETDSVVRKLFSPTHKLPNLKVKWPIATVGKVRGLARGMGGMAERARLRNAMHFAAAARGSLQVEHPERQRDTFVPIT